MTQERATGATKSTKNSKVVYSTFEEYVTDFFPPDVINFDFEGWKLPQIGEKLAFRVSEEFFQKSVKAAKGRNVT